VNPERPSLLVSATAEPSPSGPPRLRVEIRILDDGRVVFGDLPPDLVEVASVLAGGTELASDGHGLERSVG